jgi:sugar phosphate isomerase/epimerase
MKKIFSLGLICSSLFFMTNFKSEKIELLKPKPLISLAEWSLHKELFAKKITNMDFPRIAGEMGFGGVEYVNSFFKDKAENFKYLDSLKVEMKKAKVAPVLIMIDGEGPLGSLKKEERDAAIEKHKKWVLAAKYLGCHSIRVNAYGEGSEAEVAEAAIDGLGRLAEFAAPHKIGVIVENHGGHSSKGAWLSGVMKSINKPNCGTLPDFGNFCIKREPKGCAESYDKYQGVEELMPYAKGVSAKSYEFDKNGICTDTDYLRMIEIVKKAGYKGFIGVEYEGSKHSEREGIKLTRDLLIKLM